MVYIKTAIITLLLVIGISVAYILTTFNADYELNIAAEAFLKGDYAEATAVLDKLDTSLSPAHSHLYKGYIARAQQNIQLSQQEMLAALASMKTKTQPTLLLQEVYLNLAFNAFLMKDKKQLETTLREANELFPNEGWLLFFQAIDDYINGNYARALELFRSTQQKVPLSPWMKKAFGEVFTPIWEQTHIARSEMELGRYLAARQLLEEISHQASIEESMQIQLLIGLSYMKEAEEKPLSAATPYYKLAFSYFQRIPIQDERFKEEREKILAKITHVAQELITRQLYENLLFYVNILSSWKATQDVNQIVTDLIDALDRNLAAEKWKKVQELTALLNKLIQDDQLRATLSDKFEQSLKKLLEDEKTAPLMYYWELTRNFAHDPTALSQQLGAIAVKKAMDVIPRDSPSLDKTAPLIVFWDAVEADPAQRQAFAKQLVDVAQSIWLEPGEQKKAFLLMKIAASIPRVTDPQAIQVAIKDSISALYAKASQDRIEDLPSLLDAARAFNVKDLTIFDPQVAAQQMELAVKLYNEKKLGEAEKYAQWVLHLNPDSEDAKHLLGLIYYQQGLYKQALDNFSTLTSQSEDVKQALLVSRYFSGQRSEAEKELEALATSHALNNNTLLKLSFGLLGEGDAKAALHWLDRVQPPDREVRAGLFYALYLLGDYGGALQQYDQLDATLKKLFVLQGLKIQCMINQGLGVAAGEAIINLLQQTQQPQLTDGSPPFVEFLTDTLSPFDRYLVAARYYKDVQRDVETAMRYAHKIENPSPLLRIERANFFLDAGEPVAADEDLTAAAKGIEGASGNRRWLPLLAATYSRLGNDLNAYLYYQQYLALEPPTVTQREQFSKVLANLKCYPQALSQMLEVRALRTLPTEYYSLYVDSLLKTNHFEEGVEQTMIWLNQETPPPLIDKLKLSRQMLIARTNQITTSVLEKITEPQKLAFDEMVVYLNLLQDLGNYKKVEDLVKPILADLTSSKDGIHTLIRLNLALSRLPEALELARIQYKRDPFDLIAKDLIELHEQDPTVLRRRLDDLRQQRSEMTNDLAVVLPYMRSLTNLATAAHRVKDANVSGYNDELVQGYFLLDKAGARYQELPAVFYYLGRADYLLGRAGRATTALEKSLLLAPSYTDASKTLASIMQKEKDSQRAIELLNSATRFDPTDADAWTALGKLYIHEGDFYEAKMALTSAITYKPDSIRDYILLGRVLIELKNPEDAKVAFQQAVRIAPNNVEALKYLLRTLYDQAVLMTYSKHQDLRKDRITTYLQLYALDPDGALEILKQYGDTPPTKEELEQKLVQ